MFPQSSPWNRCRKALRTLLLMGAATVGACDTLVAQPESSGLLDSSIENSTGQIRVSEPWWESRVRRSISKTAEPVPVSLEDLLLSTLENSSQVKVFSDIPLIRETSIIEAQGRFDWHAFVESSWDSASHPVGSNLDTGVPGRDRLNQDQWNGTVGLRKQTVTGGTAEFKQRVGTFDNNSRFLVPQDQGNSRLSMSFTQPLLNGAGRPYNTSVILLSEIDANIAQDEFARQLQSHLLEVTRSYWTLHLERTLLLQKLNLYHQGLSVQEGLNARQGLDVVSSQLVLVDAAVTQRKAELIRAAAAVRNSEARIRALVNDPGLEGDGLELIPLDLPTLEYIPVSKHDVRAIAIQQRPEIQQNIKQLQAAGVRLDMSKNELLPRLNAVFDLYAEGLDSSYGITDAWAGQFSQGRPSYVIGFQFDIPIGNRQARGRYWRREIELRQMQNQLSTTIATLALEAEVAVRELDTSYSEMLLKHESMQAAVAQVASMQERWSLLPGEDQTGALFLQNLLDAQSRATAAESEFARAQLTYSLAVMNLKKATGTLLKQEMIGQSRTSDNGIPSIILSKPHLTPTEETQLEPTPVE